MKKKLKAFCHLKTRQAKLFCGIALTVFLFFNTAESLAISFDQYHSQFEINFYLRLVAIRYPRIVSFAKLGQSEQGREISYIIISKKLPKNKPAIYFNGTHHGNEKASTEGILGLIDYLLRNRNTPEVSELLENYAIYLQPLVNPDGHASDSRLDSTGQDLNRDYSNPEKSDEDSFEAVETRLVKNLSDQVKFRAAVAYHSGMKAVLWPWCYSGNHTGHNDLFYTLSKISALAMGSTYYKQSYDDYPTSGEFIDYLYMAHQTLAVTFEVVKKWTPDPEVIPSVVNNSVNAAMAFMTALSDYDKGTLVLESPPENVEREFHPEWDEHALRKTGLEK